MKRPICTSVCFIISGDKLTPEDVSRDLNIPPHVNWKKGEEYNQGDQVRIRPGGVWKLESENVVSSNILDDHISWLLSLLSPSERMLRTYLADSSCDVGLIIWETPSYGISLSSNRLAEIANVSNTVRFVAFDDCEE